MAGNLRAIRILNTNPHPDLFDISSSVDRGLNVTHQFRCAVPAPKGKPRPVIERLADAIEETAEDKSTQALIQQLGDEPGYRGPDDFAREWLKDLTCKRNSPGSTRNGASSGGRDARGPLKRRDTT